MAYNQPYVPSTYVPSSAPQPSTAPASALSSGNWSCPICTSVNAAGQQACKTCGEMAPAGVAGPVPVPYQQPQQQQYQPTQQPAGYSPYPQQPQQTSQPYASVYSAPAPHHPHPQHPTTQTRTLRVPVPPGVDPGQQVRVQTGNIGGRGADQSVVVTVPDRSTWGVDATGRPTFDVILGPGQSVTPAPVPAAAQGPYGSSGAGATAGAMPAPTSVYGNAGAGKGAHGSSGGYQTSAPPAAPGAMQQQQYYSGKDAEMKREFDKLDKDHSGYIDRGDLKKLLGGTIPNSQIDKIIGYVDKNKDGRVSFEEYKKIMKKVKMAEKVFGKTKYGKKLGLH